MRQISRIGFILIVILLARPAAAANAIAVPLSVAQSTAYVSCDGRQGSGAVINAEQGYIVTNGHVAMDTATGLTASECDVGFVADASLVPRSFYHASVVRAVFEATKGTDFAILKIGRHISGPAMQRWSQIRTNEFARVGDAVGVLGFPGSAGGALTVVFGSIIGFSRGSVVTDAELSAGSSGGPAIDQNNNLIGVATRIISSVNPSSGQDTPLNYELGDVLGLINWLDAAGPKAHDQYIIHADSAAFDSAPYVIREESLGCTDFVRTQLSPAVYCLLPGNLRLVFPSQYVYFSWFPDFSGVLLARLEDISKYRLVGSVTYKAGVLVKIQTDPKVYLVNDNIGTLRWIQNEQTAAALFGSDWAAKVKDVPVAFFADYTTGNPI